MAEHLQNKTRKAKSTGFTCFLQAYNSRSKLPSVIKDGGQQQTLTSYANEKYTA